MDLPAKSLFPNSLTDADIATNIVVHALKQGRGKSRKQKTDKYFVKYIIRCSCGGRIADCLFFPPDSLNLFLSDIFYLFLSVLNLSCLVH